MKALVGISNRHVHLTKEVWDVLFGDNVVEVRNNLNQPGQFASKSVVDLKVDDRIINHVRVVGPLRSYNQVELLDSDLKFLSLETSRRQSGDLDNTPGITLVGPCGEVKIDKGVILSEAHIHISSSVASLLRLKDKSLVDVIKDGRKVLKAKIKISDKAFIELHIDKEEELLYDLHTRDLVDFKLCGK